MKTVAVLFVLLSFLNVYAANEDKANRCLEIMTDGYRRDSQSFTLNMAGYDMPEFGRDHLAKAIYVIKQLVDKEGCTRQDINFGKGPFGRSRSSCKLIEPGIPSSLSCYVQTNLGYFHVSYDYLDNASIFFSRWD
ncbi:MAG: hypothetical protein Fur0010_07690 [Bdellovibrio sp.]